MKTNREHNAEVLAACNALVRYSHDARWSAARYEEGVVYTPSGLKIAPPKEMVIVPLETILDEYDKHNATAVSIP